MTLPEFTLKYDSCTKAEIWQFCKQRHAPVGSKHREISKAKCIKALRTLDKEAVFPFLSLSPELRLMVYPYLLTHDYGQDFSGKNRKLASEAFPQILRASKLCYKEARDVLYDRSSLTLTILDHDRLLGWPQRIGGDIMFDVGTHGYGEGIKALSEQLDNFDNLRHAKILIMAFGLPHGKWSKYGLGFLVSAILCAFLRAGKSLKVLTVAYVRNCLHAPEETDHATEREDDMATAEEVESFEKAILSTELMEILSEETVVKLVGFRKATRKELLSLRRDMMC